MGKGSLIKILSLVLVFLFLLAPAAGCVQVPIDDSGDYSYAYGGESENSEAEPEKINVDIGEINRVMTGEIDRTKKKVSLLNGCGYTTSVPVSSEYPDAAGKTLTDGVFAGAYYSDEKKKPLWCGYVITGKNEQVIELTLGKKVTKIADIEVSVCFNFGYGIRQFGKVDFYIACEGSDYIFLGSVYIPSDIQECDYYSAALKLRESVDADNIKIVISEFDKGWLFIDEISAYKYEGEVGTTVDPTKNENYYGDSEVPVIGTPVYWSSGESDYNSTINLLQGLTHKIAAGDSLETAYAVDNYNTKATDKRLTDGKKANSASMGDGSWFRITRGISRSFIFDLGKTSAVTGYSLGFLYEKSPNIHYPEKVDIYASEDGDGWQKIKLLDGFTESGDSGILRLEGEFDEKYRARYILIYLPVTVHVYADEFAIMGTKNVSGAKTLVQTEIPVSKPIDKYAGGEEFNFRDVFLSYISDLPGQSANKNITKEIYMPHTAYIVDGEIKDTMFDSFLFLPYVRFLYNGSAKRELKKSDWQYYIDTQFASGENMDALNAAVGETKRALGRDDYKVSVFMPLFFPVTTVTSFGEVNGKNLNFTILEDRIAALRWMIDEQLRVYNSKNYENLYIEGFYWFTEEVNFGDDQIREILADITGYVRGLGFITSWIPYYNAGGFNQWKDLGFDITCYQPNYAFNVETPEKQLYDAAAAAKKLGMCIEIEVGGNTAPFITKLKKYYKAGAETGFMNEAVHMYYQGGVPGTIYAAYISEDPYIHSVYDDTYRFIKGTFDPNIEDIDGSAISCDKNSSVNGKMEITSEYAVKSIETAVSPKYGTLRMNNSGAFVYTPYEDYAGADYFEIVVDFGFSASNTVRIDITVNG